MMRQSLIKKAQILALITISYNIVEGLVSVFFGLQEETLALLGFGVDSFVEVISGIGILHLVLRMKITEVKDLDKFEKKALKITGISFYVLTAGLLLGSVINLYSGNKPDSTLPGIIVSLISLSTMYLLMNNKLKVGAALNSDAIIADANCTKTCFWLSLILLGSSLLYELAGIQYFDIAGSLGIAYYAFREGKEAMDKVKSGNISCNCHK